MTNITPLPKGWITGGSTPEEYHFLLDRKTFHKEASSCLLKSKIEKPTGFGTLMQDFSANKYLGKRMKLSAFVKAEKVEGWAGLWMKVEGAGHDVLGFDNMKNRAIKGTLDWEKVDIILDVPKDSKIIAFGILLSGKGSVWIDDVKFEEVDKNVEVTNMEKPLPTSPQNLDFNE